MVHTLTYLLELFGQVLFIPFEHADKVVKAAGNFSRAVG